VNRRELAVLLLLTAAFLVGGGITYLKRSVLRRQAALSPIAVVQAAEAARSSDTTNDRPPVDLNRATTRELDRLPGIGPILAARIVEYRRRRGGFGSIGELISVPGIGRKRYAALKDRVMVGPPVASLDLGR